ncbi:mannose-1-phosphate guanyltransferase, partial [Vibrio xuii]
QSVKNALPHALDGKLVTFGIVPTAPETGYGYIKRGAKSSVKAFPNSLSDAHYVDSFVEKPDKFKAQAYVDSGEYYWNSGMFMFKASRYIEELKQHCPAILDACKSALIGAQADMDFIRVAKALFEA